jgi:acetyl/propionyl-CoA carboxylase alpha subunit
MVPPGAARDPDPHRDPDPARAPGAADPIRVLFVANRGEIARRISTTARRLGKMAVLPEVATSGGPAEQGSPPGPSAADGSTPGPLAVDLLDPRAVVAAALSAGADAVHPGYGFLAESPDLTEAVLEAGLTWIGPPAQAIRALGDKASAREIARSVGVPVAAGEEPLDQSDAALTAAAERIGLPILVKPAAGGGGKGIRIVTTWGELEAALTTARREARRAFADERLILERYLAPARHVEVQILADAHGGVVHLGDRDCSLQRRHQKILEEAPAPGLDPAIRGAIHAAAVRITAAVRYVGAGTCEFLVTDDGTWVFLEMNARLQVEHPVTELVVGRDLVADQLRIAEGRTLGSLGLDQAALDARIGSGGHAIEVRLNAEDPGSGFLPASGPLVAVRWPPGATAFGSVGPSGIRVDAGIETGDVVEGRFDPLLAKVIAHGRDRDDALARLSLAIEATEVLGVVTNIGFLRRVLRIPEVVDGRVRTETLGVSSAARTAASDPPIPEASWSAAAALLLDELASRPGSPPAASVRGSRPGFDPTWGGGWRANLPARARLVADPAAGEEERTVVLEVAGGRALDGIRLAGAMGPGPGAVPTASPSASPAAVPSAPLGARHGDTAFVSVAGRSTAFRLAPPPSLSRAPTAGHGPSTAAVSTELVAPMPGRVVAVHAAVGAEVEAGDRVVTLEAMKMEHVVASPRAARVREVLVRTGDQVVRGKVVATLEDRT